MAVLRYYWTDDPQLVLCPPAFKGGAKNNGDSYNWFAAENH